MKEEKEYLKQNENKYNQRANNQIQMKTIVSWLTLFLNGNRSKKLFFMKSTNTLNSLKGMVKTQKNDEKCNKYF